MTKFKSWFIIKEDDGYLMCGAIYNYPGVEDGTLTKSLPITRAGITSDHRYLAIEFGDDVALCYLKQSHPCNDTSKDAYEFAKAMLSEEDARTLLHVYTSMAIVNEARLKLCAEQLEVGDTLICLNRDRFGYFDFGVHKTSSKGYVVLRIADSDNPHTIKLVDEEGEALYYYNVIGKGEVGIAPVDRVHLCNSGKESIQIRNYTPTKVNLGLMEHAVFQNAYI